MQIGEAISYGNTGDRILVKLPDGRTVSAIAGNVINSSKVLLAGDYAFSGTSPQVENYRILELYRSEETPQRILEETCQIFIAGIWQYREKIPLREVNYLNESWRYIDSQGGSSVHLCFNRGDGSGEYTDYQSCMEANKRAVADDYVDSQETEMIGNMLYFRGFFVKSYEMYLVPFGTSFDINNDEDRENYYRGLTFLPQDVYIPYRQETSVAAATLTRPDFFAHYLPGYKRDFIQAETEYRFKITLSTSNPEGLVVERKIRVRIDQFTNEDIVQRTYLDKATDADEEYGVIEETIGEIEDISDNIFAPLSGYSCGATSDPDDPNKTIYVCEKFVQATYEQLRTGDAGIYLRILLKDIDDEQRLERTNGLYHEFWDLKVKAELLRNVNWDRNHTEYVHSYYLKLHTPTDAKLTLTDNDLPPVKLIELDQREVMYYYFTFLGNKAYFTAHISKLREPEVPFADRTTARIEVSEIEFTPTEITVQKTEYNYPDFINHNLDDWQHFWSYSYTNELSGNACFDAYKYTSQVFAAEPAFREYSLQANKNTLYKFEATNTFIPLGTNYKDPLFTQDETEIEIEFFGYSDDGNSCNLSTSRNVTVTLPRFIFPEGLNTDSDDWVLNELAVFKICE